ncbi:SMI1/KNR4 family protein [Nocardia yunnanensis]|uniref:SMI1/KNR4 family protein n=1 Tax=Nocardia yunnanensis TaxID=2382165 RepID=UPI0013C51994|nr:SMI1/KNR4 family protein [Nocardia yunnanensis]
MADPTSLQAMDSLRHDLLASGIATSPSEIIGCSDSEIDQVVSTADGFPIPDAYIAFLKAFGRKAGNLFRGTDLFFPGLLDAKDSAVDIASGPDETLTLDNRFFFGHHQGYKVYFFEAGSEAVFGYQEGHPHDQRLANSLADWLRHALTVQKELAGKN